MVFTGKFVLIWLTISSCCGSISLTLVLISRDSTLSTLCHRRGFDYQERVVKAFLYTGYLLCNDGVVYLWPLLVNLYVYGSPFHLAIVQSD